MIRGKRGLSDVVTNVLIILLVLVAISLVWFFVSGTIRTGAGQTAGAADCLTISVEPVSCDSSDGAVVVKRNVGSGSLFGLKIIVTDSAGQDAVFDGSSATAQGLKELETATFTTTTETFSTGDKITIAPVVGDSKTSKTCPVSNVKVTCT